MTGNHNPETAAHIYQQTLTAMLETAGHTVHHRHPDRRSAPAHDVLVVEHRRTGNLTLVAGRSLAAFSGDHNNWVDDLGSLAELLDNGDHVASQAAMIIGGNVRDNICVPADRIDTLKRAATRLAPGRLFVLTTDELLAHVTGSCAHRTFLSGETV